ncbi:MAG: hypothetical protein J6O09_04075 [Lachnospiraceae bacterium]|nr:hypothetical protein [Lachnospiraceae bacterium]
MKNIEKIKSIIVILCFAVTIAFPYYARFLSYDNELIGAEEKIEFSFDKIDDYIMQNFPGRALVINFKNKFLYETFGISPNETIVNVDDNLFASETLNYYYHGLYSVTEKYVKELVLKFKKLNDFCKKNGKKVLILLTPTKPRFYGGPLPLVDNIILKYQDKSISNDIRSYDLLKNELKKTDIYCFDFIETIERDRYKYLSGDVPLFYKGALHWSNYKGNIASLELHDYMRSVMGIKVPHIKVEASRSEVAMMPDSDLFDTLNLGIKSKDRYYNVSNVIDEYESDELNYTIRGGSFMTGLVLIPITAGYRNNCVLMSNKIAFFDNYKKHITFDSYDELDEKIGLVDHIKNTDVFIFEIHEVNVYNATFGFIDYVLDHLEGV